MCPSRVAVNAAGRKEVNVTYSSLAEPKVEIELEAMPPEEPTPVKVKQEVVDPAAVALLSDLKQEIGATDSKVKVEPQE